MALTLSQQAARAADTTFRARVDAALVRELPFIIAEASSVTGYAKRQALAQSMVRTAGWQQNIESFYRFMASQTRATDLLDDITEGDYTAAIAAVYNIVAGLNVSD